MNALHCQRSFKIPQPVECAPVGGQRQATVLTGRGVCLVVGQVHGLDLEGLDETLRLWVGRTGCRAGSSTLTSGSERGMQRGVEEYDDDINAYYSVPYVLPASEALEARRLGELRDRWLNPPEWVKWVDEPVPGYPRRPVPRDEDSVKALRKRTLTNLYNARPQWLADAHSALDAAVAAAYGWPSDISDDDALRELLALNGGGP